MSTFNAPAVLAAAARRIKPIADALAQWFQGDASVTISNGTQVIPSLAKMTADVQALVDTSDASQINQRAYAGYPNAANVTPCSAGDGVTKGLLYASPSNGLFYEALFTGTASSDPADDAANFRLVDRRPETVSIVAWGGAGDWSDSAGTDNYAVLSRIVEAIGAAVVVRLPRVANASNVYYFASSSWSAFAQVVLDADEGVSVVMSNDGMLYSQTRLEVRRPLMVQFVSPAYAMQVLPKSQPRAADKSVWLSDAGFDRSVISPVNCNTAELSQLKIAWPSGDDAAADAVASTTASGITFGALPADGYWHLGMRRCAPGDELTIDVESVSGNPTMVALVQGDGGYAGLYWDTSLSGANTQTFRKLRGASATAADVQWLGKGTHSSYNGDRSQVTIRITGPTTFDVLFNGQVISSNTTQSPIARAGFGAYGGSGSPSVTFANWTLRRAGEFAGVGLVQPLIIGDSKSATRINGWVQYFVQVLEATAGIRVLPPVNYAVPGQDSGQQLAKLQSLGVPTSPVATNLAIIDVGTNNVQGLESVSGLLSDVASMVTQIRTANPACKILIGNFTLWYTQGQAGAGLGQASSNYDQGARYRQALARFAADNGCVLVELTGHEGPVVAQLLNATLAPYIPAGSVEPMVADNIHPGSHASRLRGWLYARAAAGALVPKPTLALTWQTLPAGAYANGWSQNSGQPVRWRVNESGEVQFAGVANVGTTTNGTAIAQLPLSAIPEATMRAAGFTETGLAGVIVDNTGAVKCYNVPASSSTLAWDLLRYKQFNGRS